MIREYNIKKKMFPNGVVELTLYHKSIEVGFSRDMNRINKHPKHYIPFDSNLYESDFDFSDGDWTKLLPGNKDISIIKSLNRTRNKVFEYANANEWDWFCTFTFSEEKVLDRFDYTELSKKLSKWLENMRLRYCKDMKYLIVPEKHKSGAFHFHGLFSNCDGLNFVPAINNALFHNGRSNKYFGKQLVRKGKKVFNIQRFNLGFTECTKVEDSHAVANYILKYVTKELVSEVANRKRYWNSRNLEKPKEETFLLDMNEYETLMQELVAGYAVQNPDLYVKEYEMKHADFENKITYLRYDSKKVDIDFSPGDIGPVARRKVNM